MKIVDWMSSLSPGRWFRASLATVVLAIVLPVLAPASEMPTGQAVLTTSSGEHIFSIEIAKTPGDKARGLMFREQMAANHGMIFIYAESGQRFFWMKNTPLSLDIIFLDQGKVVKIARGTTPFSTDVIPSETPANWVLELVAGRALEIGLQVGDAIQLSEKD